MTITEQLAAALREIIRLSDEADEADELTELSAKEIIEALAVEQTARAALAAYDAQPAADDEATIERVARAIYDGRYAIGGGVWAYVDTKDVWRGYARAALAAMAAPAPAANDATVERVARAIYQASPTVWVETREPTTMDSPTYERVTRPIPWDELLGGKSVSVEASAVNETRSRARAALAAMVAPAPADTKGSGQ